MNMKIFSNSNERHFKTPFHAYQFANVRNLEAILEDIESGRIVTNIGEIFDVTFPVDEQLNAGMESPWDKNDVPFDY
jgi:hypothetical protein